MSEERIYAARKIDSKGDPAKIPCAMTLDFSVIVGAKIGDVDVLAKILEDAINEVLRSCTAHNIDAYLRYGQVRPTRHEELVAIIPRKVHYTADGLKQFCDTVHVSKKNLTNDRSKVTCKLCLKLMQPRGTLGEP